MSSKLFLYEMANEVIENERKTFLDKIGQSSDDTITVPSQPSVVGNSFFLAKADAVEIKEEHFEGTHIDPDPGINSK